MPWLKSRHVIFLDVEDGIMLLLEHIHVISGWSPHKRWWEIFCILNVTLMWFLPLLLSKNSVFSQKFVAHLMWSQSCMNYIAMLRSVLYQTIHYRSCRVFLPVLVKNYFPKQNLEFYFYKVDSLFTLERKKLLGQKEDDLGMRTLHFVLNTLDG